MCSKRQKARCAVTKTIWLALVMTSLVAGMMLCSSGCSSGLDYTPPPGPPVEVDLTLAVAVTDGDGNPLEALVTIEVHEDLLDYDPQVYQFVADSTTEQRTIYFIGGDPGGNFTWNFNGYWEDFSTILVRSTNYWIVHVTVTKNGYVPYYYDRLVWHEFTKDSGHYGMYFIVALQSVS